MPEFKPEKLAPKQQFVFEGDWPVSIAFLGDGRVAAGNRGGQIFIWNVDEEDGEKKPAQEKKDDKAKQPNSKYLGLKGSPPVRQLLGHTNEVSQLIALSDGKTLISASLDRTIRIWDTSDKATGSAKVVLDIKAREKLSKRDKGALGAPGVKVPTQESLHVLSGHKDWIKTLAISKDEKRLISGDDDCLTIVWDLESRKPITQWKGYRDNWISSVALSPDGKTAFAAEYCASRGSFDRPPAQVKFYDADQGKEKLDVLKIQFPDVKQRDNSYSYGTKWVKFTGRGLVCAAFSPDGKMLAAGQGGETSTGKVHLIDVATGKLIRTVSGHKYGVCDVTFSADGHYILSGGRDTTVRICKVSDGKEVKTLGKARGGQFKDWMASVVISPNQQRVAAADIAGIVHIWETPSS